MLLKNDAALQIQRFFAGYRFKKQIALRQVIDNSPYAQLLSVFDLRFQCMRAVAAAKFPINKPLEDKDQIARVIANVTDLAKEKGIQNLEAIAQLFQHNITLSTAIQAPYYDLIWTKSHYGERNIQQLINNAYDQLWNLVLLNDLPIELIEEKDCYTSANVLMLARDVIQHASKTIIKLLAEPSNQLLDEIAQKEFSEAIEKMLANYMTPGVLAQSKENIKRLTESVSKCATY